MQVETEEAHNIWVNWFAYGFAVPKVKGVQQEDEVMDQVDKFYVQPLRPFLSPGPARVVRYSLPMSTSLRSPLRTE